MGKEIWKAGNMLNPVPAVMVSVADKEGNANILTVAWAGTICTNPPMLSISVRPERYSYHMIKETNEFVVNLTTKDLVKETDFCGVRSGRDVDKYKELGLTKSKMEHVSAPGIAESPVNIECKVRKIEELGSHHMFIADVVGVVVDDKYFDETNRFHINDTNLIMYSHGEYFALGEKLGKFGYSVKKSKKNKKQKDKKTKEK
ncbi:flavin reductase family protein [Lachnobacterium bovis]|jgi:flavin reductase (DIM6/NTAB) family NADH-FMN oxidoreductase RutF|uniref:NADH-FMN oxidoreductase RutF, flavin reductase (DIM6/NTAB) family n=1 Tax=Lachnobacterium bovis DSM 14045 TaxID=1122142 RepID=A0A1H3HLA6_9FIRM|nr:flavin reductase family protein [Lachnobacterium bovis]MBQ1801899.1 flavin reductase family protein [Lachnobacterium sp.]SDY16160.1 NADH-FMN oxidoreductase RutF, flavin reductase (DIM6/NTAB) family [Lachnobacterium bovis DSM 14045]